MSETPAQDADYVRPWPLDPLPFECAWIEGYKPEPVTVALLVHRLRIACETIQEIGDSLDEWWESEGEAQNPIDPGTGYRELPRFFEQWLMHASWVQDCERIINAYSEAVRPLYPARIDGPVQRVNHEALQQMRETDNRLLEGGADYA